MELRSARLTVLAVLCASTVALVAAQPAQADRIGDARAQAERAWAQIQSDGERLERVVEQANGAHLRLARTESRIRTNQKLLSVTRINLANSEHALSVSLISAYKSPLPDPLQAALSARNFGEVLEQFALLDRTNSYNASMLRAIRVYRGDIVRRQRLLDRERTLRRRPSPSWIRCRRASARRWPPRSGATRVCGSRCGACSTSAGRPRSRRRGAPPRGYRRRARRTTTVAVNDIGGDERGRRRGRRPPCPPRRRSARVP